MRVPVVIPALKKIYGENFLDHFTKHCSDRTLEETFPNVLNDAKYVGVPITFTAPALYGALKLAGFSFKKKSKTGMKKEAPVFKKFVNAFGGEEEAKKFLGSKSWSVKDATAAVNEKTGQTFSVANIYAFGPRWGIKFIVGKRGAQKGAKGTRPSPILDKFLASFENEDEAKTYLASLSDLTLDEATRNINKKTKEDFSPANIYSFFGKYGFSFKKKRNTKSKEEKEKLVGQVSLDSKDPNLDQATPGSITKILYKCSCCGEMKATKTTHLLIPLSLRGMRCHSCNKWATYSAKVVQEDSTRYFAMIESEMTEGVKVSMEMEVDENLNPFHIESTEEILEKV